MPLLKSKYQAPLLFRNAHFSTIYASTIRKVALPVPKRERLELPDKDFIDLDWNFSENSSSNKLLLSMHGLAGNTQKPYMQGLAKIFTENEWDVAGINLRSCSGEINRLYRSYNAGATEDLEAVLQHILKKEKYDEIALAGFSLGGNLLLKYLGESQNIPGQVKTAVAVSTPCDLAASLNELNKTRNILYSKRFVRNLKKELYQRQLAFPDKLKKQQISSCNSLLAIDELYTSRAHGYENAAHYYAACSCLPFLADIKIPTLLINAQNDSFLSPHSYPLEIAKNSKYFYLETPRHGGHVGFFQSGKAYYHEKKALEFAQQQLNKER